MPTRTRAKFPSNARLLPASLALLGVVFVIAPHSRAQSAPTVTFTLDFPGSEPEHFSLSVSSDGRSTYDSNGKLSEQSEAGDPFHLEFTMSEATRTRIFALAKRANYFHGELDSKKRNLAYTGVKVLAYKDGSTSNSATYNYSLVPGVQDLTQLFQDLSATLEYGRRLEYDHRYQKLALDEEMKTMEDAVGARGLVELQAIAPILQAIVKDPAVMNVVRLRARHLLAQVNVPTQ